MKESINDTVHMWRSENKLNLFMGIKTNVCRLLLGLMLV